MYNFKEQTYWPEYFDRVMELDTEAQLRVIVSKTRTRLPQSETLREAIDQDGCGVILASMRFNPFPAPL